MIRKTALPLSLLAVLVAACAPAESPESQEEATAQADEAFTLCPPPANVDIHQNAGQFTNTNDLCPASVNFWTTWYEAYNFTATPSWDLQPLNPADCAGTFIHMKVYPIDYNTLQPRYDDLVAERHFDGEWKFPGYCDMPNAPQVLDLVPSYDYAAGYRVWVSAYQAANNRQADVTVHGLFY